MVVVAVHGALVEDVTAARQETEDTSAMVTGAPGKDTFEPVVVVPDLDITPGLLGSANVVPAPTVLWSGGNVITTELDVDISGHRECGENDVEVNSGVGAKGGVSNRRRLSSAVWAPANADIGGVLLAPRALGVPPSPCYRLSFTCRRATSDFCSSICSSADSFSPPTAALSATCCYVALY